MNNSKNNQLITLVITAIIVGVLAFFAGTQINKGGARNGPGGGGQFPGRSGQPMSGAGGGMQPLSGQITNNDGTSLTIKTVDGSSKIGIVSAKTTINKTTSASSADLKVGETVTVFGTTGSDGSMEINTISIGNNNSLGTMPEGGQQGQGNN